jgi:hypothetical protein
MNRAQSFIAFGLLAVSAIALSQQPDVPKPQPQTKKMHGEGCVEAGVEPRCLIVRDVAHAKLYNILVGTPRPTPGEGIEFTGIVHQGPTVCMQGTAIEVEHWQRKESLKCRHTPAPRK